MRVNFYLHSRKTSDVMPLIRVIRFLRVVLPTIAIVSVLASLLHSEPILFSDLPWSGPQYLKREAYACTSRLSAGGYWMPCQMHGDYYNVNALGERLAVGAPAKYRHTIWIFGNSQLFSPFVADADTSASLLQRLLPQFRVINRSAGGQVYSGEVRWLMDSPIMPGDLVLIIAGRNDTLHGYLYALKMAAENAFTCRCSVLVVKQPTNGFFGIRMPNYALPAADFVDEVHLNAKGERDNAFALYKLITTF